MSRRRSSKAHSSSGSSSSSTIPSAQGVVTTASEADFKLPPPPLITVRDFREEWRMLLKLDDPIDELERSTVDLSWEDVFVPTPFGQIEAAIFREMVPTTPTVYFNTFLTAWHC